MQHLGDLGEIGKSSFLASHSHNLWRVLDKDRHQKSMFFFEMCPFYKVVLRGVGYLRWSHHELLLLSRYHVRILVPHDAKHPLREKRCSDLVF